MVFLNGLTSVSQMALRLFFRTSSCFFQKVLYVLIDLCFFPKTPISHYQKKIRQADLEINRDAIETKLQKDELKRLRDGYLIK
jgi:hypothetical protein